MSNIIKSIDSQSNMKLYVDDCLPKREHTSYDYIFLIEGTMKLELGHRISTMHASDVVIIDKNQIYECKKQSEKNLFFVMEISENLLMKSAQVGGLSFNCCSMDSLDRNYDEIRLQSLKVIELLLLKERRANFLLYSSIYQLLNEMISSFSVYTRSSSKKDMRVNEIIEYIYDHYYDDLSLKSVAAKFYMDPIYFSKFFKKRVGMNFKSYVVSLRLSFIERELRETSKSVIRIAADNGFANINSFNKLFKDHYGVTPTHYREKEAVIAETKEAEEPDSEAGRRYHAYRSRMDTSSEYTDSVIVTDVSQKLGEINPIWSCLVNIGQAKELLSDRMKKHILLLKQEIDYRYMRIWRIFTEQLYTDKKDGMTINFEKLDEIFDFLIDNHIYPWIELNKYDYTAGTQMIDGELSQWESLFSSFLEHVINRYGKKNIKKWYFELTLNKQTDDKDIDRYCQFYKATKSIIKEVSPEICFGGACLKVLTNDNQLPDLLGRLKHLDFDFYSFMMFPYSYYQKQTREERNAQRIADANYVLNRLLFVDQMMEMLSKKKVFITEWNNTVSNKNVLNDSLYKGAYIVKNLFDCIGKIDGIGYWVASDIHHSSPKTNEILNGGSGLLNKYGMYKPAMHAMKFFKELNATDLVYQGENTLVLRAESDELLVMSHNYQHPNQLYFLKNEDKILPNELDVLFTDEKKLFQIRLTHLHPGRYEIRTYTCNELNGNLLGRWKELDFSKSLRPSDISYLQGKNTIQMQLEKVIIDEDYIELEKIAETNEFFMIHLRRETKIRKEL